MKKLLSLLVVCTAVLCFASEAQAGLNIGISLGSPYRSYRHCDDNYSRGYSRSVSYYNETPRYYRPRRRAVYYTAPVYYSQPRYSYRYRDCD